MTTHIMVDLETWGLTPGSDIRSIGAVVFDPVAGTLGDEFYVNVMNPIVTPGGVDGDEEYDPIYRYDLTRDPSTEAWWADQSEAAQQRLTTDVVDLKLGLARFGDWWVDHTTTASDFDVATFWAHGPHFDEAILAACYRATGLAVPWHYRAPRDCRTIWEAAGGVDLPFEGVQHDALADAKHQARCVIEAYRRLGVVLPLGSELATTHARLTAITRQFEDACHMNETMMDACVEDAGCNDRATDLRKRAERITKLVGEVMA